MIGWKNKSIFNPKLLNRLSKIFKSPDKSLWNKQERSKINLGKGFVQILNLTFNKNFKTILENQKNLKLLMKMNWIHIKTFYFPEIIMNKLIFLLKINYSRNRWAGLGMFLLQIIT